MHPDYVIELWGGPRDGHRMMVGELYGSYVLTGPTMSLRDWTMAVTLDNMPVKTFAWTYRRTEQKTGDGAATIYKLERVSATH